MTTPRLVAAVFGARSSSCRNPSVTCSARALGFERACVDRQAEDALAGGGEDRVAERRNDRRQSRLAEAGGRMVGGEEMYLNRRHLVHAQRLHAIEIGFDDTAALDGDCLAQRCTEPVERGALRLLLGAARVDDLAADVGDNPNMIELDLARGCDRRLDHLGEIAEMAEV